MKRVRSQVDSHRVVVHWSVFRGVPLKHKLPVVQVTSSSAFFEPTQISLLWFSEPHHSYIQISRSLNLYCGEGERKLSTNLDGLEFFAFIFLLSELLSAVVLLIPVVLSLHTLSPLSSLPFLRVLCIEQSELLSTGFDHTTKNRLLETS